MSRPPSRPLTLLAFWAAGNVSIAPFSQVTCAKTAPASQAFTFLGGGARRFQWRTYPLTLALEVNVLDDFLIIFPWSRVFGRTLGPVHRVSGLWERGVWCKDRSVSGLVLFSDVGGLRGSGERGPRPGDVGGIHSVIVRVQHDGPLRPARTRAVSATCAGQVEPFPAGVPDLHVLVECVARSRVVGSYEGVLFGEDGWSGVVAVDSRLSSCWFDVHRLGLLRDDVIPGLLCCLLTRRWPVQDSRRMCAVLCRLSTAGDRLRWAGRACAALGGAGRFRRCCPACS